jgi:hypothetical protein
MLLDYGKHYFLGAFRIVNTQEVKSAVPQAKKKVKNKKKGSNKSGQAQRKRTKATNK